MSTLQENLNAIKLDKDTNLKPENLKKNVTCLGITGTLETGGIDTSDATATANDIARGKTAYTNGIKIEGALEVLEGPADYGPGMIQQYGTNNYDEEPAIQATVLSGDNALYNQIVTPNRTITVNIMQSKIAELVGLTADKIVSGNTILGIEGTAKTEQSLTLDELPLEGLGDDFIDKHNDKFEFTDYDTNVIQNISYAEDMNGIFPIFKDLDIVKIGVVGATGNNSYPYIITKLKENQSTYYMGYFSVTVNYTDGTKKQTSSDNTYLTGRTYGEYMVYSTSEMSINLIPNISKENISNIKITMQNTM